MQHWLDYRQRQPRPQGGYSAGLGVVWHLMMQDWYRGRQGRVSQDDLAVSIPATHLTWTPRSEAEQDSLSTLLWMWDGFLQTGDAFRDGTVMGVEQEWVVPLPRVSGQPSHVSVNLKVVIDLLIRRGADRWVVVDHKSQARHQEAGSLSRDMDMDDQLGLYLYAVRQRTGAPARHLSACWNYAVTTDTKTKPRPPEDRFWLAWSARTDMAIDRIAIDAAQSALDAYARPLDVEPPRHADKENCRWRCNRREPCYYARDANRPVELQEPTRADQAPDGIDRLYY